MKKVLCIFLSLALVLSLTAALAEGETVKLTIYAQYADDDTKVPYDYAVSKLAEAYPNVELELIVQAQDDGATLLALAASNHLPDIYQTGSGILSTFRQSGQIMVLNDAAVQTGFIDKVYPSCYDFLYADDGNIYAFPYAGQEYVLWYCNKALFEGNGLEIPTTYDELLHCIDVFNAAGIIPMALFGQEGWITSSMYDVVASRYSAGGIKALDRGAATITDEAYVSAAETLKALVEAGMFQTSVTSTNYDQASELFLTGKAAMFLNGQWYIESAATALGDDACWIYYPSFDAASYEAGKAVFSGGGSISGYAVNPASENAALAAEVAAFISEKYCEAKITLRNNPLVALNVGMTNDTLPAMMNALVAAIPSMTSTTAFAWGLTNPVFADAIGSWSQALISGEYTVDEFVSEISAAM
ncbi:MAG: extracellular solute-binding protein, partial [Bacillota bacterium]